MEQVKQFFSCLIPDRALTGYEQFAVGMTTGGAFRDIFRSAEASFENGEVIVRLQTDVVAGGNEVIAAKIPIKDITDVRISPVPVGEQVRAAAVRGLVVSGGFALTIIVMITASGNQRVAHSFGANLGFALLFGLGLGFFFSFLPSIMKLKLNLLQVLLITSDNQALVMAIEASEKETSLAMFSAHGLKVSDTATSENTA